MISKRGIRVIDSDQIVHDLYGPGGKAVEPIQMKFPSAVPPGENFVDRKALSTAIGGTKERIKCLERIVHPLVKEQQVLALRFASQNDEDIVVLDVPLMYETGSDAMCDAVLVVSATSDVQRNRVMQRPGMTTEKFEWIIERQMDEEERVSRADFVIRTDVALQYTEQEENHLIDSLSARKATAYHRIAFDVL
jgi:dephospho-CoA kinase